MLLNWADLGVQGLLSLTLSSRGGEGTTTLLVATEMRVRRSVPWRSNDRTPGALEQPASWGHSELAAPGDGRTPLERGLLLFE